MMNQLWEDIAPGYYNYGRISPGTNADDIKDLKQANEDMVDFLIDELEITKESLILDIGCGKGMYTVRMAQITGCRFVGVDYDEIYIEEECRKNAQRCGVENQGEFICGSITNLPDKVKEMTFSHVLALGVMCHVHDQVPVFLENVAVCSDKDTRIFIWDFIRKVNWSECSEANTHLKWDILLSKEEVLQCIETSKLILTRYEDATAYIIPSYNVMERECRKRDPEMTTLTYPLVAKAFRSGLLGYVYYHLRLK